VRLAVLVAGSPPLLAQHELVALERDGCLAAVFATEGGRWRPHRPGAERVLGKLRVLAPGTPAAQAAEVAARLAGSGVSAVHSLVSGASDVAARAARRLRIPYGFSVDRADGSTLRAPTVARQARRARCVIAPDPELADRLRRAGAPAQVVPRGVDLERFPATPPPRGAVLSMLAVGPLEERAGFSLLVEAAAWMLAPFRLRIVGEGPQREALAGQIAAAHLSERIELVGLALADGLPAEYAAAQVVIVPSLSGAAGTRESLPDVVLEAMASGRPVIATDVGSVRRAVVDGHTGVLVPPGDAGALTGALEFLVDQPRFRERLGREGHARVARHFALHSAGTRLRRALQAAYA
jgi:colanic acid/amylovoran biosynthesis glycosyltransferase